MDTPLDNPDMEILTDGSSFVWDGKRKAGYAMVTAEQVLEAKSLPKGNSAQLAELVALTRALELSKGQRMGLIIYESTSADSKYPESAVGSSRQCLPVLDSLLCCIPQSV